MILSGKEIEKEIERGRIKIDPFNPKQLNPNSYNLRLDKQLLVYGDGGGWSKATQITKRNDSIMLDMARGNRFTEFDIPDDGLILWPGMLYLGSTMEYTETDGLVPFIEGRSSVGRLGMTTHVTAGLGDANFKGTWTLEIAVVHPLRVYSGVEICQICYLEMKGEQTPYEGKYQGQRGPKASGLWRDFQRNG